jgi:hypothetical protein
LFWKTVRIQGGGGGGGDVDDDIHHGSTNI